MAKKAKRWIVKVKKTLRRQTWRERIVASGKKDPLVCPKCECYYEYKGEDYYRSKLTRRMMQMGRNSCGLQKIVAIQQ